MSGLSPQVGFNLSGLRRFKNGCVSRPLKPADSVPPSLHRVGTGFGDLAVLNRGRAGDADGSDNLAIRYEGNAAFERRGSAQRERAQPRPPCATKSSNTLLGRR